MKEKYYTMVESPVGKLLLAGRDGELTDLHFWGRGDCPPPAPGWILSDKPFREVTGQLKAYFKGALRRFDLPLAPSGTPFQKAAWRELRRIPYGETISYGEQARRLGKPGAARAAGAANGRNPISIIIPCHRVIGADGSLVGFGAGVDIKKKLLLREGVSLVKFK
ncbi:MAG: methylated-DNA--[protein]-cysteine S-methyltransferase [Candidatus Krumholzibacteriota bacterium]|nr:methylated-DNA--[protein]-cysteine S-methyltransferase [Candidatus Krumholzibacteriota bacterium]